MAFKDSREPVASEEHVFRRVSAQYIGTNPSEPVNYAAFKPAPNDVTGISFFREDCGVTPQQVADLKQSHCYIIRLSVEEILNVRIVGREDVRLTVVERHSEDTLPGHAELPQITVSVREQNKHLYTDIAVALAKISQDKVVLKKA